jgi:hypothetical protein
VFVDEVDRDRMVRIDTRAYERLGWGRRIVGLRVDLEHAKPEDVRALLETAWRRRVRDGSLAGRLSP